MSDTEIDGEEPVIKFDLETEVEITPEEVVRWAKHDPELIFEFIARMDEWTEDWGLTLRLAEHFARVKEIYQRELAEDPPGGGEG